MAIQVRDISRGVGSNFSAGRGDVFIAAEHRTAAQTPKVRV